MSEAASGVALMMLADEGEKFPLCLAQVLSNKSIDEARGFRGAAEEETSHKFKFTEVGKQDFNEFKKASK